MVDILSLMSSINEDIKKLFEQAYQQAYMQGRKDQDLISKYRLTDDDARKWLDFHLPSGNLWQNFSAGWMPYNELIPLPTKDEFIELFQHVDLIMMWWQSSGAGMNWLKLHAATKGEEINWSGVVMDLMTWDWHSKRVPLDKDEHLDFWIKESDDKPTASIVRLTFEEIAPRHEYKVNWEFVDNVFKGDNARWLIVKRPQ